MEKLTDYLFYSQSYLGNSIPAEEFPRLAARAGAKLAQYQRAYRVEGEPEQLAMATCALADALYYYEEAENGAVAASVSVGSVSSSAKLPDTSPSAQAAELLRCVKLYLRVYRGVG